MNINKKIIYLMSLIVMIIGGCSTTPPVVQLNGTNVAGGELNWTPTATTNPVSGTNYLFISNKDVDYLVSKKANFIRLLFSWENMQPTLNGPLANSAYATNMKAVVDYATSKGLTVMIEPHGASGNNFAAYKGNKVGSAAVPNSAFADFWAKMATLYGNNPKVVYGLSNEPNGMSTMQWFNAAQACIVSIRATGSRQMIMVPGNGWTGSATWSQNWYDTASPQISNATAWLSTIKDPINNTVASVHMYFDVNASGVTTDVVSPTIGVDRVSAITAWARTNKVKIHISEFGASANTPNASLAVKNFMDYTKANSDVIVGSSWWTYGSIPFWNSYQFTLVPSSNYTVDAAQMSWLTPYFSGQPVSTTVPAPAPTITTPPVATVAPVVSPTFPTAPITFTKNTPFTTNSGTVNYVYVPGTYDATHQTPMTLFVWLHGCGGLSSGDVWTASLGSTQQYITLAPGGAESACWNVNTDVAKVLAAIKDVKTHFNINPRRVILGGYSSGGDLTYRTIFYNSNLFAGALVTNSSPFRDTGSSSASSMSAASWKFNVVHLAHLQDTTYPIAGVRTETDLMKNAGFPITRLEKAGNHWDNDVTTNGVTTGTDNDIRTALLPYIASSNWLSPDLSVSSDAGTVSQDAGQAVDAGMKDAGIAADSGLTVDSGTILPKFSTRVDVYNVWQKGTVNAGYCANIYVTNNTSVNAAWHTMNVSLGANGTLQNAWNVVPVPVNSKTPISFQPTGLHVQWLTANGGSSNIGFCATGDGPPVVTSIN